MTMLFRRIAPVLVGAAMVLAAACGGEPPAVLDRPTSGGSGAAVAPQTPIITIDRAAVPGPDQADGDTAYQHVKVLAEQIGTRVAGTPEERRAADYIAEQLRSYGYTVELQEFPIENATADVRVSGALNRRLEGLGFNATQSLGATGPLVHVGLGRPADLPAGGLTGKIALIQRGEIQFQEKIRNATNAGASGVIVYNNQAGLVRGAVTDQLKVPAIIVSQNDGEDLVAALKTGTVTGAVTMKVDKTMALNVIGRSQPGPCQTVTGGHFDSVVTSPGGNDNASGTAAVLETSRLAAKRGHVRNDCFIAFGAEEEGLLGSEAFVRGLTDRELTSLKAMINLDMVGTPTRWELIGDEKLTSLGQRAAQDLGISVSAGRLPPNVGSDHQSFMEAGVPVLMLYRDDNRLHTPQDTAAIVQPESLRDAARIAVEVLDRLG